MQKKRKTSHWPGTQTEEHPIMTIALKARKNLIPVTSQVQDK